MLVRPPQVFDISFHGDGPLGTRLAVFPWKSARAVRQSASCGEGVLGTESRADRSGAVPGRAATVRFRHAAEIEYPATCRKHMINEGHPH
jgi:hypothetical protein